MASSGSPALDKLYRLDTSSPDFGGQLSGLLYGEEYAHCALNFKGDDLIWLIDYLDKALNVLEPSSKAFRKCLRELRCICGTRAILPTSHLLSPQLLDIRTQPFASGGFGDVYHGTLNGSGVCIKRLRVYLKDGPEKVAKAFCQEAVMWKRLKHPNVVPLLGTTISPFQLISPWMPGGDLLEYIKNNSDAYRLGLLLDIADGLRYLHSCNVIHGDLKGSNILVDDSGSAHIADFGLAAVTRNLDSVLSTSLRTGHTVRWAAPEVMDKGTHTKEADIFAFAMVMVEVFTGDVPFCNGSSVMAMSAIIQRKRPPRPTHPNFTENLWKLMQRCWDHNPKLRPEAEQVLEVLRTPEDPAWKRLITRHLTPHERISLITEIFSDHNQVTIVGLLSGAEAQTFLDMVDEALDSLKPSARVECLRYLRKICGNQGLIPRSLAIQFRYDPTVCPLYRGAFADVWKGHHDGRDVAAKVLRLPPKNDSKPVIKNFCRDVVTWKSLHHPHVLQLIGVTMTGGKFVMVSEWMKNGNILEFVARHPDVNRLNLLKDVTQGLIYMHQQKVIHGNLKGTNILINDHGRACLTDFRLLTIVSDLPSPDKILAELGNSIRWMSPELLNLERFYTNTGPTEESDCFGLGMLIYEVLSGTVPFHHDNEPVALLKILHGEHPERPKLGGGGAGVRFPDGLWEMLRMCWRKVPDQRPGLDLVLRCLQHPTRLLSRRPSYDVGEYRDPSDATTSESIPLVGYTDSDRPPGQPQSGDSKKVGIVGRLARGARRILRAATKKLHKFRQPNDGWRRTWETP